MSKPFRIRDSNRFKMSQPCPTCEGSGRVDWIDLVKGSAAHSCRECGYYWVDFQWRPADEALQEA
jgi:DnaJ-class molecular chaperone